MVARTQASAQRSQDFTAALIAQVGSDETERLLRRYPQPLEEISAPEVPLDVAVAVDADGVSRFVYHLGLQSDLLQHATEPETTGRRLREAFDAAWVGAAVSDGFTALVLRAGLNWRTVAVLWEQVAAATDHAASQFRDGEIVNS